ncbi:MAG: hypothetical protein ACK50Y_06810, partial [Flavobacteriia bacterium]
MKSYLSLILVLLLAACSEDETPNKKKKLASEDVAQFKGVETLFNESNFPDAKHKELLKELKICSEFQKDTTNYMEPACSPKFFRILPMTDDTKEENAFLLQIKSKVGGIKLRRTVAFVREKGELTKVNTFVANLIGTRPSKQHYYD